MEISVVIPVYGCREALFELHRRLCESLSDLTDSFEIILVDDCCPQNSWEDIQKICKMDSKVKGIRLSRNFGQERAITAGMDYALGNYIVVMDCDLQDRPEGIKDLYHKICEGYDIVFAKRKNRKDTKKTLLLSGLFYKVFNQLSGADVNSETGNFSIISKTVADYYRRSHEQARDYAIYMKWLGFRQTAIDIEADERAAGESSYTMVKKIRMAVDYITAESSKPLYFSIYAGMVFSILSILYVIYLIIHFFADGDVPEGWTTVVISIWFVGGIIMMFLGMVGIYIGNIFQEAKGRPLYAVQTVLNDAGGKKDQ